MNQICVHSLEHAVPVADAVLSIKFGFIRIERSLLVNIRAVLYAETVDRGRFAFTLSSGACLHSSSGYREAILRALPLASSSSRGTCQ